MKCTADGFNEEMLACKNEKEIGQECDSNQKLKKVFQNPPITPWSYGVSGQKFGLICLFSVIDSFEWFWMESPLNYDLNGFKSRINRHLSFAGFF